MHTHIVFSFYYGIYGYRYILKKKDETEQNFFGSSLMPQNHLEAKWLSIPTMDSEEDTKKQISYCQNRPGERMTVIKNYSMRVLWNSDWAARG